VLESSILFSGSVFSMLGEVLTPKMLASSTKYWIFFLSAHTHAHTLTRVHTESLQNELNN